MINKQPTLLMFALAACVACGSDSASPGPTVRAIAVSPGTATVVLGNTLPLVATVSADDGVPITVSWSSNNPSVATVSGSGVVTGVATGSATISAHSTVVPTVSGSVAITVISGIGAVSIAPVPIALTLGTKIVVKATVAGVQGAAVSQSVTWETTRASYFSVASDGTVSGTAVGSGGTLRARSAIDTSIVSAEVAVSVTAKVIVGDPCAPRVFDLLVPINGTLTTASCLGTSLGSFGDRTYGDWYSYRTTTTSLIMLRTTSPSFTPVMAPIARPGGAYFARSNPFGGADSVFVLIPAGTTTMFTGTRDATRIGPYTLDATFNPAVPSCNTVFTTLGVAGTFTIKHGCGFTPQGLTGFYDFQDFFINLMEGTTVTVRVTSTDFIPLVEIRDFNNNVVISSLGQNQSTVTVTYVAQATGIAPAIYVASRSGSVGTFTITIDR